MDDYRAFLKEIENPIEEGLIIHNRTDIHNHLHITGAIDLVANYKTPKVKEFQQYLSRTYPYATFVIQHWNRPFDHAVGFSIHYIFTNDLLGDGY